MEGSWWKDRSELDSEQETFFELPADGNYLLVGPPGSGKTNLLLLRANYLFSKKYKNTLFLTLGTGLVDFLQTGVKPAKHLPARQIQSFHGWARQHCQLYAPEESKALRGTSGFEEMRRLLSSILPIACTNCGTNQLYDAIFVDEIQDLSASELQALASLTTRLNVAGDNRQSVYKGDALPWAKASGIFHEYNLHRHYRIGRNICEFADKLYPPAKGQPLLLSNCNYNEVKRTSSVTRVECADLNEQFKQMETSINVQLKAFPGEAIGVLVAKREVFDQLSQVIAGSSLAEHFIAHNAESKSAFMSGRTVHLMTIHSSKGCEFRAVHVFAAEQIQFPMNRRDIIYTAATRAKTALSVYFTGEVLPFIESAFATDQAVPDDNIF